MTTATNSAAAAPTAVAAQTQTSAQKPGQAPAPASKTQDPKYKPEDYNGAPIVKLKLRQEGIMQYDPVFKLKLDSTEPVEMPLTPFFAARLNTTVILCTE